MYLHLLVCSHYLDPASKSFAIIQLIITDFPWYSPNYSEENWSVVTIFKFLIPKYHFPLSSLSLITLLISLIHCILFLIPLSLLIIENSILLIILISRSSNLYQIHICFFLPYTQILTSPNSLSFPLSSINLVIDLSSNFPEFIKVHFSLVPFFLIFGFTPSFVLSDLSKLYLSHFSFHLVIIETNLNWFLVLYLSFENLFHLSLL